MTFIDEGQLLNEVSVCHQKLTGHLHQRGPFFVPLELPEASLCRRRLPFETHRLLEFETS